jgi:hypothetical protein
VITYYKTNCYYEAPFSGAKAEAQTGQSRAGGGWEVTICLGEKIPKTFKAFTISRLDGTSLGKSVKKRSS